MVERLDSTFTALADPTRREMLAELMRGEKSVGELAAPHSMSFAGAAKHVGVLERAGLIERRKVGRQQLCRLRAEPLREADLYLRQWEEFWTARLDALEDILKETGMTDMLTAQELRFERLLDAPTATVWSYLVDPDLRARWFMGGPTDLRPGGKIGMTMNHDQLSDGDVPTPEKYQKVLGHSWSETITRVEPERLLAFGWDNGDNGEVVITLAPEGEKTRLTLVHSGIKNRDGAINFAGGWASHLAVLERRLRGEAVPNFWALHSEADARAKEALAA